MANVTAADAVDQAKNWTLYLYMSSENNLKEESGRNIEDIRQHIGPSKTTAVIYQDLRDRTNFEFLRGTKTLDQVSLGSRDFSKADTLDDFLTRAGAEASPPDTQQMLVLWGHGRGMLFLPDNQTPEGAMDVISAASALMEPKDHKFDIIGFDACFMCVLEVVNDFAGACRYFVASPSLIPSTGWAYGEMLEAVGGLNAAPDPKNMSKIISKAYETKYQDKFSGSRLVQLSTIETARLPDLVAAFRTLGNEIARILDGGGPPTETLRKALTLARQIALTPPGAFDYVDAVDLANRLTGLLPKDFDPSLIAACKDFATKADGIFTEDRDLPSFLIWFPLQRGIYARWRPLYDKLNTSHESDSSETVGWARMLSRYHGMSDIPDREDGFMAPGNRIFMALRHRDQLKPRLEERIKTKERIDK